LCQTGQYCSNHWAGTGTTANTTENFQIITAVSTHQTSVGAVFATKKLGKETRNNRINHLIFSRLLCTASSHRPTVCERCVLPSRRVVGRGRRTLRWRILLPGRLVVGHAGTVLASRYRVGWGNHSTGHVEHFQQYCFFNCRKETKHSGRLRAVVFVSLQNMTTCLNPL
jgi:hypothetical protein